MTFEGTLLFALNAVGLAFVFLSHDDPPIATHLLTEPTAAVAVVGLGLREVPGTSVCTRAQYPRLRSDRGISRMDCAQKSAGVRG